MARKKVVISSVAAAVAGLTGTTAQAAISSEQKQDAQKMGEQATVLRPFGDHLMRFTIGEHKDGRVVADHSSHASHSSHSSSR